MKKINRGLALLTVVAMMAGVAGCGANNSSNSSSNGTDGADTKKLNIGIVQYMEHSALDSAREGFIEALKDNGYVDGEKITIDLQNALGDQSNLSTICDRFVSN